MSLGACVNPAPICPLLRQSEPLCVSGSGNKNPEMRLSSYFVRGKGTNATLQGNARLSHLPRMLIWVSPTLTRPTGVTMRNLRRCRQL